MAEEKKVSLDTIASYVETAVELLEEEKGNARYNKFGTTVAIVAGEEKEFKWEVRIARLKVGMPRQWASRVMVRCGNGQVARDLRFKLFDKNIIHDTSLPNDIDFYAVRAPKK